MARKLIYILFSLLFAFNVYASVELDSDANGATDIDKGGTNSQDGSIISVKQSGIPGIVKLYTADALVEFGSGFVGPDTATDNTLYKLPSTDPTVGQQWSFSAPVTTVIDSVSYEVITMYWVDNGGGTTITWQTTDPDTTDPSGLYINTTDGDAFAVDSGVGISTWTTTYTLIPEDFTDILFWSGFENDWTYPTYTLGTGDYPVTGTLTSSSAVDINATGAIIGSNGIQASTSSDYLIGDLSLNMNDLRIGFWVTIVGTWVAVEGNNVVLRYDASNDIAIGQSATSGELYIQLDTGGTTEIDLNTSGLGLATDTAYYVELILDQAGNGTTLKVDGVVTSIANEAYTAYTNNAIIQRYGNIDSSTTNEVHVDNIAISDDVDRDLNLLKNLTASPR